MHQRQQRIPNLVTTGCWSLALVLMAGHAAAYHRDGEHILEDTAYTLGNKDYQVGLWSETLAVHRHVDLSTYLWPWFVKTPNIRVKTQIDVCPSLAVGLSLASFRLDVQKLNPDAPPANVSVVPLAVVGSYAQGRNVWSLQASYSFMLVAGTFADDSLHGAAAMSNLQLVGAWEHRWSETFASVLTARVLAHQWQPSVYAGYETHPDPYTTVELYGSAEMDVLQMGEAFSIVPSVVWSWSNFNLRLGVGYGNMNIGGVNILLPRKSVVPDLDLYWRW